MAHGMVQQAVLGERQARAASGPPPSAPRRHRLSGPSAGPACTIQLCFKGHHGINEEEHLTCVKIRQAQVQAIPLGEHSVSFRSACVCSTLSPLVRLQRCQLALFLYSTLSITAGLAV